MPRVPASPDPAVAQRNAARATMRDQSFRRDRSAYAGVQLPDDPRAIRWLEATGVISPGVPPMPRDHFPRPTDPDATVLGNVSSDELTGRPRSKSQRSSLPDAKPPSLRAWYGV